MGAGEVSRTPIVIYVIWHPESAEAAKLATEIYRWFHVSSDDLLRSGMGVPVFFRSERCQPDSAEPRAIQLSEAECNVVVVLAESHLVADSVWAEYVQRIGADQSGNKTIVPVALHPSAYRLPDVLTQLNFLRVDERDDPRVDAPALHARRTPRLLRQLTEVTGRQLVGQVRNAPQHGSPHPLTIFLSHAKRDGVHVAEALRSTIQNNGRVRAFFDDSDLPVGHAFATELERAAVDGSAAMIAIVSDAYASRPWCRKEIALARKPRQDAEGSSCWWIQPVIVVDALHSAPTRSIPELGNATLVRWTEAGALHIVDLLMLEVLLNSYHRLRARRIEPKPGRHVICWTPDVPTLLALQREAEMAKLPLAEVIYPGHALPQTDLQALRDLFPAVTLSTFEEIERPWERRVGTTDHVVGLSSAFNEDLGGLGLGKEHLEEVTLRIARCIVESGGRIAFGGMLNSNRLTGTLLTLVRTLSSDGDDTRAARTPRILSFQRWPSLPDADRIASDVGISEYVLIDSPLPKEQRLPDNRRLASPSRARELAKALSAMREAMTHGGRPTTARRDAPGLDARIVVGGVRVGFNGFMPGVLEEVLYALEARRPVYLIGGFGGAAGVMARGVLQKDDAERQLHPSYHRSSSPKFVMLEKGLAKHGEEQHTTQLFGRLRKVMAEVRADIQGRLDNGLDKAQNERLMQSDHVAEIIQLLRIGLARRVAQEVR